MVAEFGNPKPSGPSPTDSRLRDLLMPRPPMDVRGLLVVVIVLGTCTCLGALLLPSGFSPGAPSIGAGIGVVAAALVLNQYRGRRAIGDLGALRHQPPTSTAEFETALARLLVRSLGIVGSGDVALHSRRSVAGAVAEVLAGRGECGLVYRFATPRVVLAAPGLPFEVPFEPVPLDARSPALRALRNDDRGAVERFRDNVLHSPLGRWGRSHWGVWFMWVFVALYAIGFGGLLISIVVDLLQGRISDMLIWLLIGMSGASVGLLWQLWHPQRWFVVPGAVVVGTSAWRSTRWTLEMFRADEGVLVYWADAQRLAVATREGRSASIRATADAAEVAIRAWLSPLKPPPLEQFSDLT